MKLYLFHLSLESEWRVHYPWLQWQVEHSAYNIVLQEKKLLQSPLSNMLIYVRG